MREPLQLDEADIRATLEQYYGLAVSELVFLPLGDDTGSAAYRLDAAGGGRYFLKVRRGGAFSAASLAVPRARCARGVPPVLAPRPPRADCGRRPATMPSAFLPLSRAASPPPAASAGPSGGPWGPPCAAFPTPR